MATTNAHKQHRSTLNAYLRSHSKNTDTANSFRKNDVGSKKTKQISPKPSTLTREKEEHKPVKFPTFLSTNERKLKATVNNLPDEIIAKIFWTLKVGDLLNASQVCKRWHKVANDNLLWKYFYKHFVGPTSKEKEDAIPLQELDNGCWKNLCLKQCKIKRDKTYLKKWKNPDSYTGLKQRPELTLSKVGISFELSLIDGSGVTWSTGMSDVYWHTISASVRWYDLTFPYLVSVRAVRIHACSPLMFYGPSKPAKDGIVQKALLTEWKGNLKELLQKSNPIKDDSQILLYDIINGLIIGTYKLDGEIAFVTMSYHYHNLIARCFYGAPDRCWEPPEVTGSADDIDPNYGLHGFTCILIVRSMRQTLVECKFTDLYTTKSQLSNGFAVFNPVKKDDKMTHIACLKEINFPWKTSTSKGVVKDVGILDVTLLDEKGEPFWVVTSCISVQQSSQTNQFEFDPGNYRMTHFHDEVGKIHVEIGRLDHGGQYLSHLAISLSLKAIDKTFGTAYLPPDDSKQKMKCDPLKAIDKKFGTTHLPPDDSKDKIKSDANAVLSKPKKFIS